MVCNPIPEDFQCVPRAGYFVGGRNMIKITFKNGHHNIVTWNKDTYTDYKYDGKCFIIIKNEQWVGIYNMDSITSVVIE